MMLAERVGWAGSPSWFRQNVALVRPDYAPTDPADRIVYHQGDQVQCDLWFPEPKIPLEDGTMVMLPVLVMVASFSKFITTLMTEPPRSFAASRNQGHFVVSRRSCRAPQSAGGHSYRRWPPVDSLACRVPLAVSRSRPVAYSGWENCSCAC